MKCVITDKELVTEAEIVERMTSIKRQREKLCYSDRKITYAGDFNKRQAKIAKLTERLDWLSGQLKQVRKG